MAPTNTPFTMVTRSIGRHRREGPLTRSSSSGSHPDPGLSMNSIRLPRRRPTKSTLRPTKRTLQKVREAPIAAGAGIDPGVGHPTTSHTPTKDFSETEKSETSLPETGTSTAEPSLAPISPVPAEDDTHTGMADEFVLPNLDAVQPLINSSAIRPVPFVPVLNSVCTGLDCPLNNPPLEWGMAPIVHLSGLYLDNGIPSDEFNELWGNSQPPLPIWLSCDRVNLGFATEDDMWMVHTFAYYHCS